MVPADGPMVPGRSFAVIRPEFGTSDESDSNNCETATRHLHLQPRATGLRGSRIHSLHEPG